MHIYTLQILRLLSGWHTILAILDAVKNLWFFYAFCNSPFFTILYLSDIPSLQ
jgi:hypothetical protein